MRVEIPLWDAFVSGALRVLQIRSRDASKSLSYVSGLCLFDRSATINAESVAL